MVLNLGFGGAVEPGQRLGETLFLVSQFDPPAFHTGHYVLRGTTAEGLVGKLAFRLFSLLPDLGPFPLEPSAFGRTIDFPFIE